MKGKRRLSGVLLIIAALIIMQLPVSEADAATSASDFKMEGTTLLKYRGTDKNVSIPATVEVIAESAFEDNDKIERVVLSDSVERIDAFAFWGCDNLDTVVLGKGLTEVGDYVFANCKGLEQMTLPANIRSIGIQAFADCVNMTDITIPPEVISIHETAFDGCSKLYIHCEAGSYVDKYAEEFYIKQSEMPEYEDVPEYESSDVTEKPTDADKADDETDTSNQNENSAKDDAELLGSTQIVNNKAVVLINNTSQTVLGKDSEPSTETDESESLDNTVQDAEQGKLPKYTIVDGRVVADQAYYKNESLGQVTLPRGIEEIGEFAFARSSVTGITVPEGVTDIRYGAFYHTDSLTKVSLPDTVENVEPKAFTYSAWVENFMENGTDDFLISGNVLVAYRGNKESVVIPEGVTVIAGEAFMNHTELKSVTLPESLLTIGEGAFEGCTNLVTINLGEKVEQIKDRAFAACPLGKLILPSSVSKMGQKVYDESVIGNVLYEGKFPESTYEISAQRLSNEKYRTITEDTSPAGVKVTGVEPAFVTLEGANRSYTLTIKMAEDTEPMTDAYYRCYQTEGSANAVIYDMQLSDSSAIPLTKLGKQMLTVIIPVPKAYTDENVIVYTLDRNGQLEQLESERVLLDGVDSVRFQTSYVSSVGIYGDGSDYSAGEVLEISTTLQSLSEGPNGTEENSEIGYMTYLKWGFVVVLLMWGTVNLLRKSRI